MIRGQKYTEQSATAQHSLGQISYDSSTGKSYVYAQANGAIALGKYAGYDASVKTATDLMTAQAYPKMLVKAGVAYTTLYYGWFQIATNDKFYYENFLTGGITSGTGNTGLPTGTAGNVNLITTANKNTFEECIKGTQTILYPTWTLGTGLVIGQDQTADDGWELTAGVTSASKCAFTVGTDGAFHFRCKVKPADVSGTDDFAIGFRKAEAYQANLDDYDEMFGINIISGTIYKTAILNGGATDDDSTTNTLADNTAITVEIKVSATGVCTILLDGAAPTSSGTAFTFDSGEVVVPFIFHLNDTDIDDSVTISAWECGLD